MDHLAQTAYLVTFTLYDPTVDIKRTLKNAAEKFSKSMKDQINNDILKQLTGSIGAISIDPSKLSHRKTDKKGQIAKGWRRLFGGG